MAISNITSKWIDGDLVFYSGTTEIIRLCASSALLSFRKEHVEFHLLENKTLALNDDGTTWTKIPDMVANLPEGFSATGGTLTKGGVAGIFAMNGVSDLKVNKACTVYYGLHVNGTLVAHEVTEHTFSVQAKLENISITALAELAVGDTIEIYAKGDGTAGIELVVGKLDVVFGCA